MRRMLVVGLSLFCAGFALRSAAQSNLSIRVDTAAGFGTANPYSATAGTGPFYSDRVRFVSSSSTPLSLLWNFGNPESPDNTTVAASGTGVVHQYSGLTTSAAISATKTVTATNQADSTISATTSLSLMIPTARVRVVETGALLQAGGSILSGDRLADASDGVVEGHYSVWTIDGTAVTVRPDQPVAGGACGSHTASLQARYVPYTSSGSTITPALPNGAHYVISGTSTYTARPFLSPIDSVVGATTVTFQSAKRAIVTSSPFTYQWDLLNASGAVVQQQSRTLAPGQDDSFVVNKSALPSGGTVRLTISTDPTSLPTACQSFATFVTTTPVPSTMPPTPPPNMCAPLTANSVFITYASPTCTPTFGTCQTGEAIQFNVFAFNYNLGCAAHTFNWNFGDGSTGTGQVITHAYAVSGTYTVMLTVNNGVQSLTVSDRVVVGPVQQPPVRTGTITDPAGDAAKDNRVSPSPDLVSGSAAASGANLLLTVRFAPGTFNAQNTRAQVSLDTDQNPDTGHPGTTSDGTVDARVIGTDFFVSLGPGASGSVLRYNGCRNCFVSAGNATVTLAADGYDVTVPLAAIGNDDGAINFKVTTSAQSSGGISTGILDWMPDADSAGGSNRQIAYFRATPALIARGKTSTLSFSTVGSTSVTIDNGVGAVPTTGTVEVQPLQTTTYTLTATRGDQSETAQVRVEVVATPSIVITGFPRGMTQVANAAGGRDRLVITNAGGAGGTVTLTTQATFFTMSPTVFSIAPGGSQTVQIIGLPQPANGYSGTIVLSGDGVAAGTTARVTLLSFLAPASPVVPSATSPRVDVISKGTGLVQGSVPIRNDGTGTLQGIAVADALWVTPESGLITIAPGTSRNVGFTIDPTKRSLAGSETATLSLVYVDQAGTSGRLETHADPPANRISSSLVHTIDPDKSTGTIPPLDAGSVAYFVAGLPRAGMLIPQVFALNRPRNASNVDVRMHFVPSGLTAQALTAAFMSVIPGTSVLLKNARETFQSGGAGTVQVRSARFDDVAVTASLVTTRSSGLFGTYLAPIRSDRSAGPNGRIHLAGVRAEANTSVTLYLQEASGSATTAQTRFYDDGGNQIATRTDSLAGFDLAELANVVPAGASSAVITNTGSGKLIARAIVNESSGDVTDIVDWPLRNAIGSTEPQVIPIPLGSLPPPAVSRVEVTILNSGQGTLQGTLSWISSIPVRRRGVRSNSTATLRRDEHAEASITLAPLQTRTISDVLRELGVAAGSIGSIRFAPTSGNATITARVRQYTALRGDFGTTLPVVGALAGLRKSESREFAGIEADSVRATPRPSAYESSMTLIEIDGKPVKVKATLQYSGGSADGRATGIRPQEEKVYALSGRAMLQIPDLARDLIGSERDDLGDLHDMRLDLVVTEGDGTVIPIIISTENATRDPILRLD